MIIKICDSCEGEGKIKMTDHHRNWEMVKCDTCNGTGRLKTRVFELSVPFDFDDNKVYKVDAKIIDLLRNLKNGVQIHGE